MIVSLAPLPLIVTPNQASYQGNCIHGNPVDPNDLAGRQSLGINLALSRPIWRYRTVERTRYGVLERLWVATSPITKQFEGVRVPAQQIEMRQALIRTTYNGQLNSYCNALHALGFHLSCNAKVGPRPGYQINTAGGLLLDSWWQRTRRGPRYPYWSAWVNAVVPAGAGDSLVLYEELRGIVDEATMAGVVFPHLTGHSKYLDDPITTLGLGLLFNTAERVGSYRAIDYCEYPPALEDLERIPLTSFNVQGLATLFADTYFPIDNHSLEYLLLTVSGWPGSFEITVPPQAAPTITYSYWTHHQFDINLSQHFVAMVQNWATRLRTRIIITKTDTEELLFTVGADSPCPTIYYADLLLFGFCNSAFTLIQRSF